jgi:hypothetical protein
MAGFRVERLEITDPEVLAVSGEAYHPILVRTGDDAGTVEGAVFEVTEAELPPADGYEVDDSHRVAAPLASGDSAWVYVARA